MWPTAGQNRWRDCSLGVQDALAAPLGYPPLADITSEDDRIVLAVGTPLPRAAEIVAAVVQALTGSGVNPEGITVLQATNPEEGDVCRLIPDDVRQRIQSDPPRSDKPRQNGLFGQQPTRASRSCSTGY